MFLGTVLLSSNQETLSELRISIAYVVQFMVSGTITVSACVEFTVYLMIQIQNQCLYFPIYCSMEQNSSQEHQKLPQHHQEHLRNHCY